MRQELRSLTAGAWQLFEKRHGTVHEPLACMEITHFTDLKVWQKAMDLAVDVYQMTDLYPREERFTLTAQTRKTAISIPSNIAEGFCRHSLPTYIHHLNIALGSEGELFTQLVLGKRLNFVPSTEIDLRLASLSEVGRMLTGLSASLAQRREQEPDVRG